MSAEKQAAARRLAGADREGAFSEGLAPLLLLGVSSGPGGRVTSLLDAPRAEVYVSLLYGLALLRRGHEMEPLHEDVHAFVSGAKGLEDYDPAAFAQDMEQLCAWGAVERSTEVQKLRSYRDNRRRRYRYRLAPDAVALLEWLEARLLARLEGRATDTRDRLSDALSYVRELGRLLDAWRRGPRDPEAARRSIYLLEALDESFAEASEELVAFRAEMLAFASRPYDLRALKEILAWLERYVQVYLGRIEDLRAEIHDRLRKLSSPRYRGALRECQKALEKEHALLPQALRPRGQARPTDDLLDAQLPFCAPRGRLVELCHHIDASAQAVLRKMHRHLRELERRSARVTDLKAAVARLAELPAGADVAHLLNRLVASAHARFHRRAPARGERLPPPLPRRHAAETRAQQTSRPFRKKRLTPEAARALRAARDHVLSKWLDVDVLAAADEVLLSERGLLAPGDARRWMDAARAWHLEGGRRLPALGVAIERAPGSARVGTEEEGLVAPDARIRRAAPRRAP